MIGAVCLPGKMASPSCTQLTSRCLDADPERAPNIYQVYTRFTLEVVHALLWGHMQYLLHLSYDDCLDDKREKIIRTVLCYTACAQSWAHSYEQFFQVLLQISVHVVSHVLAWLRLSCIKASFMCVISLSL